MICPNCTSYDSKVNYTLHVDSRCSTIRRRECLDCQERFTTEELVKTYKGNTNAKQLKQKNF